MYVLGGSRKQKVSVGSLSDHPLRSVQRQLGAKELVCSQRQVIRVLKKKSVISLDEMNEAFSNKLFKMASFPSCTDVESANCLADRNTVHSRFTILPGVALVNRFGLAGKAIGL